MKKIVSCLLVLLCVASLVSCDNLDELLGDTLGDALGNIIGGNLGNKYSEGLEFTLNDDKQGYALTGIGSCTDSEIVIPSVYNDLPVTKIGHTSFITFDEDNQPIPLPITSIIIPNSVTIIDYYAFSYCTSLTNITIPESVTSIRSYAFYHCTSLTSITIPNSVTSIGNLAFYDCPMLQCNEYDNAYYLGNEDNPYLILMMAKNTNITSCVIPHNTKVIDAYALFHCNELRNLSYEGTIAEWNAIEWNAIEGWYRRTVICSDGTTTLE